MKKPLLPFIFFLFFIFNVKGQNLVPNGDFEQYSACPTGLSQLDSALSWFNPFSNTLISSPDYFNQCAGASALAGVPQNSIGYQNARSGFGYAGIHRFYRFLPNYREYIECTLTSPLIAGTCYYFEMYINLANSSIFNASDIGVYLSDTLVAGVTSPSWLTYIPQINNSAGNMPDTLNWTLVSGYYTASGNESFLTIGNFKDDANTDTMTIYPGNPVESSYVFIDDVSLSPCTGIEEQNSNSEIKIYPNPVKDELFINGYSLSGKTEIKITDILGKEILRKQFSNSNIQIPITNFQSGIYFIEINNGNPDGYRDRKKFLKE
jgi:type IX secretion system substrate protein